MALLKLAGVIRESIVDGPGIRFVVFAQGCPHHCAGCHNPQPWPFAGGKATDSSKIAEEMKYYPLLSGVTLSGGVPFCQAEGMAQVARDVKALGLSVMVYTGYLYEEILKLSAEQDGVKLLLENTDWLVDGRFQEELKSYDLLYKGSSNQRILDVKRSLQAGRPVPADLT